MEVCQDCPHRQTPVCLDCTTARPEEDFACQHCHTVYDSRDVSCPVCGWSPATRQTTCPQLLPQTA